MKKTLYLYLVREQAVTLIICLLGVTFFLVTGQLLQLTKFLFATSCTVFDAAQVLLYGMPKLILYAFPMAALMGVMLAFVRLSGDNELIAFRAAGVGFRQFLPPVVFILLLCTALSFINSIYVIPAANRAFDAKLKSLGREALPALLKEGVFISAIPKLVLYFRNVDPSDMSIRGVLVQDQRHPKEKVTIVAEKAQIVVLQESNLLTFRIANGVITRIADDLKNAQAVSFKVYDFSLSLDEIFGAEKNVKKKREMGLAELYDRVVEVTNKRSRANYSLELHQRLAFPSACLLLGLMGAPLGSFFRQRGRMTGITIGIGVFLAYYIILSAGKGLGENGLVPPFLAIWTPNLLSLAVSFFLWEKIHREKPFFALRLLRGRFSQPKEPLPSHAPGVHK